MKEMITILLMLFVAMPHLSAQEANVSEAEKKTEELKKEAQEEAAPSSPSKANSGAEKITVVGSRIKRTDIEGPSPVKVIDREALVKSGFNSVGQVLQNSTVSSFGSNGETVNVRGLGATNTLVLINGRRMPKKGSVFGAQGTYINMIPISAIERVEILTDGASAVYGSEALASVINLVTRKNYDGFTVESKLSVSDPKGGDTLLVSGTLGKTFDRGFFDTSVQLQHTTRAFRGDKDYIKAGPGLDRWFLSDNYRVGSGPTATTNPFPGCTTLDAQGRCTQYYGDITSDGPNSEIGIFSNLEYELTPELVLKADVLASYTVAEGQAVPYIYQLEFGAGEAPAGGADPTDWGFLPGYTSGDPITLYHQGRFDRTSKEEQISFGANVGVEGEWAIAGEDWTWEVNNNIQTFNTKDINRNFALKDGSIAAMKAGRYDPFDLTRNDTTGMLIDPVSKDNYFVDMLSTSTEGALGTFGDLDLSMAAGVQLAYYEYSEEGDPNAISGNIAGLVGTKGSGNRTQSSAYVELAGTYSNWLETQLAGRFDNYSDFGNTFNPKLAVKIRPNKMIMLRASAGTAFKAPELQEVNGEQFNAFLSIVDHEKCQQIPPPPGACDSKSVAIVTGGNPDLTEETSFSYNAGIVAEPMDNLSFSVDYWNYEIEDIVGSDINGALELMSQNGGIAPPGFEVTRVGGEIDLIKALDTNLGTKRTDGVDFNVDYSYAHKFGKFSLIGNYSIVLNHEESFYAELGFDSQLGDYGVPRWRYDITLDYETPDGKMGLQIKRRTIANYLTQSKQETIPSDSQYDINFRWFDIKALAGGDLKIGAINAFNSQPEYDLSASPVFDESLYRPFATYYVQYAIKVW